MPKIIITRGLPGSGKSTWAKSQLKRGKVVGVNRDLLRLMTTGKWFPADEDFITDLQEHAITTAILDGKDVIVDDTFIQQKWIDKMQHLAYNLDCDFEIKSFMDVPVEECIKRDAEREKSVGKDVIERMYYEYWAQQEKPENKGLPIGKVFRTAVICDLDGTLATIPKGANPYDRDFTKDILNQPVWIVVKNAAQYFNHDVIFLSGREEKHREQTETWLEANHVPFHDQIDGENILFMRPTGDSRKDTIVKKELYMNHVQGKWEILFVLDDRPSVVRLWRAELGLTVFQVGPNIEF